MWPGPARAISNPVPMPWADPSLNASNAQQPRECSELALLECFLLEKPHLLIRQRLPILSDSPSLPWGSTTMGRAPAAALCPDG